MKGPERKVGYLRINHGSRHGRHKIDFEPKLEKHQVILGKNEE